MKTNLHKSKSVAGYALAVLGLPLLLALAPLASAQVNFYYSGFETAQDLDDWAFTGPWEIGVPTFGPPTNSTSQRAYAGTKCAATVLGGNYADNTSGRMESKPFVVPAANQAPRLRFWHWYNFNCGDAGQVQIKVGAGSWLPLTSSGLVAIPDFPSTGSGVWSQPSFDLSAYAGQTVQIGFWFSSSSGFPCGTSTAPGWYVDEVRVITGPITFNNPDSFEAGWGDWSATGTWEIGVPNSGPGSAHDGTNCAATVLAGDYWDNTSGVLISPPFVVPAEAGNPRLRFWHWYHFNCGDWGRVRIKPGTNDWVELSYYESHGSGVWSQPSFDLSAFAGQTVQIGFWFSSSSGFPCGTSTAPGWYVDEVRVITGPITFNNPDSFEAGWGDWSATGTWEIGVPNSGPGSAHDGTNCAATVLAGDYWDNTSGVLISPPFVVPAETANPRLRFWHWYHFNCGDSGSVGIKPDTNGWQTLTTFTSTSSGIWNRPAVDLSAYAGQSVQIGFWFSSSSGFPCGTSVAPGWYVDEVRLLHDFTLELPDAPIVRTQTPVCILLGVAASLPPANLSFTLQAPAGHLGNVELNTIGCWSGTLTPHSAGQWLVALQNSCPTPPTGVETIGTICFTAISAQSAFVPLTVSGLVVTNQDASLPPVHASGSRAAIIANEPLLEAWLDGGGRRMLTTYGKAGVTYVIGELDDATAPRPWLPAWTNVVPAGLSISAPVSGTLSNAPILFLEAREQ